MIVKFLNVSQQVKQRMVQVLQKQILGQRLFLLFVSDHAHVPQKQYALKRETFCSRMRNFSFSLWKF